MTNRLAIIGFSLKHSISPAFQQAALDYYDLEVEYEAWETTSMQLEATVSQLRYPNNLGANVTIPFKEEVLDFLDEVDDDAEAIGAANTIVKEDNVLVGYNTDAPGFLRALRQEGKFEPAGKSVVVLGAGGAARAVCHALVSADVAGLTLVNRSRQRADYLAQAIRGKTLGRDRMAQVDVADWEDRAIELAISTAALVVNCTSLGMKYSRQEKESPLVARQIPADILVCDLVYNPILTPLLREAGLAGARTLGGLPMLVYQGAAAFEFWTGKEAPIDIMFKAAEKALAGG